MFSFIRVAVDKVCLHSNRNSKTISNMGDVWEGIRTEDLPRTLIQGKHGTHRIKELLL